MSDLKAKMTPKSISGGAPPQPPQTLLEELTLTALPKTPLAVFKGRRLLLRRGEGKGKKEGSERREGREGEDDFTHPMSQIPGYATDDI